MFITSFGEQNITYKCCSNFLIHLYISLGATPKNQDMSKAAPNHSPEFIVDDATLKTGVESHIRFVMDYPAIASQVQKAWRNDKK
ncbi:hypothetical protein ABTE22_18700, partial [Acinetobacter baumannii]